MQTVLNIELEEDDLPPYLDRGYQRVVNRVSIPGFRKGKAPRTIVENFLGKESLIREALDFMVSDVTEKAFSERKIETAGPPDVELLDLDPVIFKATVALKPIVDLGNYRGIRVPETPPEVKDEDVESRLEALRHESASWDPVDRAVALGDMVTMDVTATVEDSEILNESDAVYVADAENEMPFPELPQRLEGAEVGVGREFDLEVPSDFGSEQIAGKTARFVVTVNDIKERKLPELDDEFAKGVGDDFDTLDALRESVRDQLQLAAEGVGREHVPGSGRRRAARERNRGAGAAVGGPRDTPHHGPPSAAVRDARGPRRGLPEAVRHDRGGGAAIDAGDRRQGPDALVRFGDARGGRGSGGRR